MSPRFPHPNRGTVLRNPTLLHPTYAYGAFTLYGGPFQATSASSGRSLFGRAHYTTSPMGFPTGFGLGSPLFARRYSGDPSWFLFLPLLGCFRSGGSRSLPPPTTWVGGFLGASQGDEPCDRKSHSGIPGSTAACASPGLIAACRALPRRSSRAIHQTASACRVYSGSASVWR